MTIFAAGIAVGLAVGVGTALLFAPQSGEEARFAIVRRARRLRRRGGDAWDDLRHELRRAGRRRMKSLRQAVRRKRDVAEEG
jgi:gas vesicle protein